MTTTPPAPTLTVHTDADPCPRVEVLITPMPVDAARITVWRSWAGQREVVRGAKETLVAGDYLVIDYEAPLGVAVEYSAVAYDVSGTPSAESAGTTATVAVTDVWVQDPLDPASALQVGLNTRRTLMCIDPSFTATYPVERVLVQPSGSALSVALSRRRRAASRMPLTIHATNTTVAQQLHDLLMQADTLCVRTPAAVTTLTGLSYLAIGDYTPDPSPGWQDVIFPLVGDSVRGPGAAVVVQPRTFDHLLDEAATFDELTALYATFIDLQRGM